MGLSKKMEEAQHTLCTAPLKNQSQKVSDTTKMPNVMPPATQNKKHKPKNLPRPSSKKYFSPYLPFTILPFLNKITLHE